jgi:hypothetical protein
VVDDQPIYPWRTFDKGDIGSDEFLRSIPGAHEYMAAESERRQLRPPTIEPSPDYGAELDIAADVVVRHRVAGQPEADTAQLVHLAGDDLADLGSK